MILSAKSENADAIRQLAAAHGLACYTLGETVGDRMRVALSGQETVDTRKKMSDAVERRIKAQRR